MQTLSNGYKKPETGDKGSVFFPALEDNIQRVNDHTHNGTDSEKLNANSVDAVNQSILNASWVTAGGGLYKQTVTLPGTLQFDTTTMMFRINSGSDAGHVVYPDVKKITANTYDIWINDNSIDLEAHYS